MTIILKNRFGHSVDDIKLMDLLNNSLPEGVAIHWTADVIAYNTETDCFELTNREGTRIIEAVHEK